MRFQEGSLFAASQKGAATIPNHNIGYSKSHILSEHRCKCLVPLPSSDLAPLTITLVLGLFALVKKETSLVCVAQP
jgi:hypothetical protein